MIKKQIAIIWLLTTSFSLSAQNSTVEQEALYYIKKAYLHRNDTDKTAILKYLKTFEDYLSANLKPENVTDTTSYYYANVITSLIHDIPDKDMMIDKINESVNWKTVYTYQIKQAEKEMLMHR